jgi:hypothetical protein
MSEPQEQRFQARIMVAVGAMVVGLCSLCTYKVSTSGGGYGLEYVVGGIPILAGAFIFAKGCLTLARTRRRPSPKRDDANE